MELKREQSVNNEQKQRLKEISTHIKELTCGNGHKDNPSLSKVKDIYLNERLTDVVNRAEAMFEENRSDDGKETFTPIIVFYELYKRQLNKLHDFTRKQLPELFDEMGISEITLDDGTKLALKSDIKPSISSKNYLQARIDMIQAEIDNGMDKEEAENVVLQRFKENYVISNVDDQIAELLFENDVEFEKKVSIHPATLKKFIKDMISRGVSIPESINVFEFIEVTVK